MLHAKTAVVDGEVTLVGSSNLDPLSMRRNYELNLLVADAATGAGMRAMFAARPREATRIDPEAWRAPPRVAARAGDGGEPVQAKSLKAATTATHVARDRSPRTGSSHSETLRGHAQGAIIGDEGPPRAGRRQVRVAGRNR